MNSCTVQLLRIYLADRLTRRLAAILAILAIGFVLLMPGVASSFSALGGYISEKLLDDGTDATPILSSSTEGPLVIASGPVVSTLPVTDSASAGGVTTATLRGNLTSLNGMPRADVWWVWGYSSGGMTNTTASTSVTTTGEKTLVLSGALPGHTVYYQFRAGTDGTSSGATRSYFSGGGHGVSYWFMQNVLPILIALSIFVTVLLLTGNPIAALIGTIIGFVAFVFAQEALKVL